MTDNTPPEQNLTRAELVYLWYQENDIGSDAQTNLEVSNHD